MPRRLLSKLLLHSAFVLLTALVAGGVAVDRFLVGSEIGRLQDEVARHAVLLRDALPHLYPDTRLQDLVRRIGEETGVRLTVVDARGVVLADSVGNPAAMENHASHPEVGEALAGRESRTLRMSGTLGIEMLYVALPGPPVVRAALPMTEVRSVIRQARLRVLLGALPGALVALAVAWLLARAFTLRVEKMIRFSGAIAGGHETSTLRPVGDDELADLERGLLALKAEIGSRVDALRRERETFAALVDGLPDAVVVLDAEGKVSLVNGPAQELLRLTAEQARGLPAAEALRAPRLLDVVDGFRAGTRIPEPVRIEWPDPPRQFEVTLRPLFGGGDRGRVLLALRDVTREVHLERVRRDFIANLSHELRTPLTAIRGSAETLLDAALSEPTAARRFLETIRRNTLRLETLLADVTDLARIEAGGAPLTMERCDVGATVRNVLSLFAAEAHKAKVGLEAKLPEEAIPLVSDPAKLESILVNLVQNGARYTPAGGTVTVAAEAATGGVLFRVDDTGIGIPVKDLPRVTERFYRVDPGRSRAMGGTGLGLSIVKHLVEILGGTLEIRSQEGKGTQVEVFVPSASTDA